MDDNEMKRITIPTITHPDESDANGFIYSKKVWNDFIDELPDGIKIPLTTRTNKNWCLTGIPISEIVGYVSDIDDAHITVDFVCYDGIPENTTKIINTCIDMINNDSVKAYMEYVADIDHKPDMAYQYIHKIRYIMYFYLGYSDPRDQTIRPLVLN